MCFGLGMEEADVERGMPNEVDPLAVLGFPRPEANVLMFCTPWAKNPNREELDLGMVVADFNSRGAGAGLDGGTKV